MDGILLPFYFVFAEFLYEKYMICRKTIINKYSKLSNLNNSNFQMKQ